MSRSVIIAPDKFKGSLSAKDAAEAIERGVGRALPGAHCGLCPMADGGEGTVDAFLAHGGTKRHVARVSGPLGEPVDAVFATDDGTAILEMASASGLALISENRRDPLKATTYGTGQLIRAALDAGSRRIIIGIGGSATSDAGVGMLRALGVRFFNGEGVELAEALRDYEHLARIDVRAIDPRLKSTQIEVASDVDNPLYGENGAARTFAAQKGASEDEIDLLDRILQKIAAVGGNVFHNDFSTKPGAGAAGGLGFALLAFLGARIERGVELIARECGLDGLLKDATLCLTGEGSIDAQTLHGKTVYGVAEIARKHHVPVVAFGGFVDKDAAAALAQRGVRVVAIAPEGTSREDSMKNAAEFLENAAATTVRNYSPRSDKPG